MKKLNITIFEYVMVSLFFIGLVFKMKHYPGQTMLIILSLLPLGIYYFLFAFKAFFNLPIGKFLKSTQFSNNQKTFGFATGFGLLVALLGVIFHIQIYPGAKTMLQLGIMILSISSILAYVKYAKTKGTFYLRVLARSGIILIVALALVSIRTSVWIELSHKDDPEMLEAELNYYHNPTPANGRVLDSLYEIRSQRYQNQE